MGLFSKLFGQQDDDKPEVKITISSSIDEPKSKVELSDDDQELLASLHQEGAVKPVALKLPFSDTCPYCGVISDKPIKRKKTCSDCKNVIYVRTTQTLYPSSALTEEQLNHAEFYETLRSTAGITKEDYVKCENALKKKWGLQKVNTYDILWSLYNSHELFMRNTDKTQDRKWQMIEFFRMQLWVGLSAARYQGNRGTSPEGYLKSAHNNAIQGAKLEEYVKGLTVKCYECCEACQKFNNKTFSVKFLEDKPVLPIPACTRPLKEGSKFTLCTCSYQSYWEPS